MRKWMNNSGRAIGLYIPPGYDYKVNWGHEKQVGEVPACLGMYATVVVKEDPDCLEGRTLIAEGSKIISYRAKPSVDSNHYPILSDENPDSDFFTEIFPKRKFYWMDENYNSKTRI